MPKYYKLNNSTLMYLNTSFGCIKTNSITATITTAGSGYTSAPTVNVASKDGGSGCALNAFLTPTTVSTSITIVSGGTGYVVGDTVVFNNTGTGGSGVAATVSAVSTGVITALNFSSQGSGYTIRAPTLTSITSTAGTGANITFNLTPTSLGSVVQVSGGSNYSVLPTITITGGGGTGAVITPAFDKTFSYTWNSISQLVINDLAKLTVFNVIVNNFVATTPYTFRISNIQYDSRNSFFSDYGQPILCITENTNVCNYGTLGGSIILTPQTINSITITVDDDITTKGSGQSASINFVIALQIEEYDPNYTEVGDVYAESASRLKLNY